jgi:hypothetical protein
MSYKLSLIPKPAYLHAVVTGENTKANVEGYLREIQQECTRSGITQALIEERLEGPRLDFMEVFHIASQVCSATQGYMKAIAYVDVNAQGDLMNFAETVAVNRGQNLSVFSSVKKAEKWLQGNLP